MCIWRSVCPRDPTQAAKKTALCLPCGHRCRGRYDQKILRVRDLSVAGWRIYLEFKRWRIRCPRYDGVHVEHLDWLAKNPRYTQRFAMHVGKLCRDMPNQCVADMERLHHSTVKDLDKLYMQKQVALAGLPAPRAIGIDELSIRKGHNYRIIVSDLERGRPIWVGGEGRKEADIDLFFQALGEKKSARIELAAVDMWKAFGNSVRKNAPTARIIFDKFHIMRHLSKALDEVRRREYKRLSGQDRRYIKGQRYTLLSRRENLKSGWKTRVEKTAPGQPASEYSLCPQGKLRTTLGLPYRTGRTHFFRAMARQPEMAAVGAVSKICRVD
jgi:transposase